MIGAVLCSLDSRRGTSEDGQFISLYGKTDKDERRERAEETVMTIPSYIFPHTEMFLSLLREQECKTSAPVSNKHLKVAQRDVCVNGK